MSIAKLIHDIPFLVAAASRQMQPTQVRDTTRQPVRDELMERMEKSYARAQAGQGRPAQ